MTKVTETIAYRQGFAVKVTRKDSQMATKTLHFTVTLVLSYPDVLLQNIETHTCVSA